MTEFLLGLAAAGVALVVSLVVALARWTVRDQRRRDERHRHVLDHRAEAERRMRRLRLRVRSRAGS